MTLEIRINRLERAAGQSGGAREPWRLQVVWIFGREIDWREAHALYDGACARYGPEYDVEVWWWDFSSDGMPAIRHLILDDDGGGRICEDGESEIEEGSPLAAQIEADRQGLLARLESKARAQMANGAVP